MKPYLISIVLIHALMQLAGQYCQVEVFVENLPDSKVYLYRFDETEYRLTDSIQSMNGTFYFYRDTLMEGAMYKIDFEDPEEGGADLFIEYIWGNESFRIIGDLLDLPASVSYDGSVENELFREFQERDNMFYAKLSSISQLLDRYPEKDQFYRDAGEQLIRVQEERNAYINDIMNEYPRLYTARIIAAYQDPLLQPELQGDDRLSYLKVHYFDLSPIDDPGLLNTPVYNRRIIDYLRLYQDPEFTFGEQENAFKEAVDIIMANVSGDPDLRAFVVGYLLEGFESLGMENIQTYIIDTYSEESCNTDAVVLARERVEGYRKMAVGQVAEDINIRSFDKGMVRLSELDTDYTLVLFWATYCSHCANLIPDIIAWYESEKPEDLEVFSVSIDSVTAGWEFFSSQIPLPWINTHEPMGWEGKSAEDYNVYATPTMFLLDRQRRIIAKPVTFRDLKRAVRKLDN